MEEVVLVTLVGWCLNLILLSWLSWLICWPFCLVQSPCDLESIGLWGQWHPQLFLLFDYLGIWLYRGQLHSSVYLVSCVSSRLAIIQFVNLWTWFKPEFEPQVWDSGLTISVNLNLLAGSGSSTERTQTSSSNLEPNLPKAKMKGSPNNILYIYLKCLKYKKSGLKRKELVVERNMRIVLDQKIWSKLKIKGHKIQAANKVIFYLSLLHCNDTIIQKR